MGSGPTGGTVSLVDTLPVGLTATAMSGTGWNVNLSTLTATRTDSLAAGGSYPAISSRSAWRPTPRPALPIRRRSPAVAKLPTGNDIATDVTNILNTSGPPSILSVTPSLAGGVLVAGSTTTLAINFSKAVLGGGTAANYQLQSAGPDGLLGTADDVMVSLSSSYSGTTATLSFAALTPGVYRLTVFGTITDTWATSSTAVAMAWPVVISPATAWSFRRCPIRCSGPRRVLAVKMVRVPWWWAISTATAYRISPS